MELKDFTYLDNIKRRIVIMTTNFEDLIPKQVLFSIKEIEELGIIKSDMCKKLIYRRELETIKIGSKNHFSRSEIIRYLQSRTISAVNSTAQKENNVPTAIAA